MIDHGIIPCEIASKSNARRWIPKARRFIKSSKALKFVEAADAVLPSLVPLYEGPVSVVARCYYATRRPDLDPQLLLDVLQGRIFQNDRQVQELHAFKFIDRSGGRVEWEVREAPPEWANEV